MSAPMRVALLPTLLLAGMLLPAAPLPFSRGDARAQESANWIPGKTAKLQALDKVTAQVTVLDAAVNRPTVMSETFHTGVAWNAGENRMSRKMPALTTAAACR